MSDRPGGMPPDNLLVPAIGALLFASGEPVHPKEIAEAFSGAAEQAIDAALEELRKQLAKSPCGLHLESVAGGFRLATRPEVAEWVRNFMRQRNRTRLSAAALETLAIVAYRQPVTAPEIQAIRGRDPAGSLKNLLDKKLLRILGRKKVVGRPLLYGTSRDFLIHFGLNSLQDLPSIEQFDEIVGAFEAAQPGLFSTDGADREAIEIEPLEPGEAEEDSSEEP